MASEIMMKMIRGLTTSSLITWVEQLERFASENEELIAAIDDELAARTPEEEE